MKKKKDLFVSAVIVAAGSGSRMNMDINKQYIDICGKPVLAWTIQAFEDCDLINEIIIVANEKDIIFCRQKTVDMYGFRKVKTITAGGKLRQNSVYNGLLEAAANCGIVLIHDGARPFVHEKSIHECIYAAERFGASCAAVPVKDTIKRADAGGIVCETLDRSILWSSQTPQAFRYDLILQAHRKAMEDGFTGTDDAALVERLGLKPKLVMGGYDNIKITTKEDLAIAEAIVGQRSQK